MAPYLITMLWLLMPQNVTINGNVTLSNVTIASPDVAIELQFQNTCEDVTLALWSETGYNDSYNRPLDIPADEVGMEGASEAFCAPFGLDVEPYAIRP